MSKSSKSPNQAKSSSSIGSMCPPTAQSPSMMTAEALTDPNAVPTALPNSVNTAIGATPSDLESLRQSGLSDTSAGSGRVSSSASTPLTAKAPTSPEIIMNDLRRGSLFGRQGKVPPNYQPPPPNMMHPPSYTNVTFEHTNMSTASQLSSVGQPLAFDQKSQKSGFSESTKTGIPMSAKSAPRGRSAAKSTAAAAKARLRSPGRRIEEIKKQEAKQKQLDEAAAAANLSKKSMKKSKKSKKSGKLRFGGLQEEEGKSKKSMKYSKKSSKSLKSTSKKSVKAPGDIDFPSPKSKSKKSQKVVKKGDGVQKQSVYLPGVMDGNAPNKVLNQDQAPKSQKSIKSSRKFNEIPAYHFPGAGKCTRSMDQVAPPTPKKAADQSHCVYDVAQLPATQRRLPPTCVGGRAPPKSIFGNKKLMQSTQRRPKSVAQPTAVGAAPAAPAPVVIPPTITPAQVSPQAAPTTNTKIVIFGKTADGKNTIQMTIDMQIVAGEALGGSDKPIQVIPQKIFVAGKEVPLDGYSQRGSTPPQ